MSHNHDYILLSLTFLGPVIIEAEHRPIFWKCQKIRRIIQYILAQFYTEADQDSCEETWLYHMMLQHIGNLVRFNVSFITTNISGWYFQWTCFKGYYIYNLKLTCFVCCRKIVTTFLEKPRSFTENIIKTNKQTKNKNKNVSIWSKLSKELKKWRWNFSRPCKRFELWIKKSKYCFGQ